jgi:hypothetical protein
MIPSKTLTITDATVATEYINCIAIEAVGGDVTFTELKEGGVQSPNQGNTLPDGLFYYSWKKTFTNINISSGTIYAHFK